MHCRVGSLYGSGKEKVPYYDPLLHGTAERMGTMQLVRAHAVRCVRDRTARTISFTIAGHCPGISFEDVPDGDLFFVCSMFDVSVCIEVV